MNYIQNSTKYSILLIFVFVFIHVLYINTPLVNYEWAYRTGTQGIFTSDKNLIKLYFNNQANPITYSFLSNLPLLIFGDHYASYRFFSLIGGTLLLISLLGRRQLFLITIVGINPLIWIYSGRAYSEIISVGMMMMALEFFRNGFLKGILGAFAAILKYHSIVVSGLYWGIKWLIKIKKHKSIELRDKNFLAGAISVVCLFIFFLLYYQKLGVWIIPEKFITTFEYRNVLNNFFSYGFFLAGMFFLTIPFHLKNTNWRWQFTAFIISLPLAITNQNRGEIDFGSLNQLMGAEIILLIKIVGFWNFLLCCKLFWNDDKSRILLLTVIIYMIILSFTRPVQRYLIFVIPFWSIMICMRLEIQKIIKIGYILIFCSLNLFATIYQVQNARASEEIGIWSKNKGIKIDAAVIFPHIGVFSHHDPKSKIKVTVSPQSNDTILFKRVVKIVDFNLREYFVVKTANSPEN